MFLQVLQYHYEINGPNWGVVQVFMLGMLATTMSKMQHNHHKASKIQLTDEDLDLEELGVMESDDERLLFGAQSVHKSDQQEGTP